jgi:ribonuclease E
VRLKDNKKEKEKILDNKKITTKKVKEVAKSRLTEESDMNFTSIENSKDTPTEIINENEDVLFLNNKDEIELTDELNKARKKRRRSSANVE